MSKWDKIRKMTHINNSEKNVMMFCRRMANTYCSTCILTINGILTTVSFQYHCKLCQDFVSVRKFVCVRGCVFFIMWNLDNVKLRQKTKKLTMEEQKHFSSIRIYIHDKNHKARWRQSEIWMKNYQKCTENEHYTIKTRQCAALWSFHFILFWCWTSNTTFNFLPRHSNWWYLHLEILFI